VPPQHGAWAFLGLPFATALVVTPWTPALLLLLVAWVAAYPASYFLLAIVRDRSGRHPAPRRYVRPLALWSAPVLLAGLPLLALRPWLALVALAYLASFSVNLAFARRRDERALANDAVFIAQCTAMVPVTWATGADPAAWPPDAPAHLWVLTAAVALLLLGSTIHVKSLIRERANPRFAHASHALALASVAASAGLAVWWGLPAGLALVVPFAYFALRSLAIRTPPRPARIGLVELVGFLLLVAAAWAAEAWATP
jgi:hypothetical protein